MAQPLGDSHPSLIDVLRHLGRFLRLERRILALVISYALVIGLFSLIVPLTVQELVNTFSFAIQPIMIATLAIIMVVVLAFVGVFRALQYYAVEVLQRRLFVRTAFAMAQKLPHVRFEDSNHVSRIALWKLHSCSVRYRPFLWIWSMCWWAA